MKILVITLIILLAALQSKLWMERGSYATAEQLQQNITKQTADNAQLRQRNLALLEEIKALKKGTSAVEEHARTDLGMVQKDEQYYQVVDGAK